MFKVGDTVELKSGSPTMTVIKDLRSGGMGVPGLTWFRCAWFGEYREDVMSTADIPDAALIASDDVEKVIEEALVEIDAYASEVLSDAQDEKDDVSGESALTESGMPPE